MLGKLMADFFLQLLPIQGHGLRRSGHSRRRSLAGRVADSARRRLGISVERAVFPLLGAGLDAGWRLGAEPRSSGTVSGAAGRDGGGFSVRTAVGCGGPFRRSRADRLFRSFRTPSLQQPRGLDRCCFQDKPGMGAEASARLRPG